MTKSKTVRVVNGRFQFLCPSCNTRRMMPVPPNVRNRSIRCQKCGEKQTCIMNRRIHAREQQMGKVTLITPDGTSLEMDLFDKSEKGFGLIIGFKDRNKIRPRQQVRFHCTWNPSLVGNHRYEVCTVIGQRVGVKRLG